ncbi:hypothetical protein CDL15_Pgr026091 [Punica granatum]|uniref:Uncharacterized protein n=1 Tax=Punica granatum TaxID=22663 RepID=A0A218WDG4_PUNGR|nr:hypothetical protein CDL15_Pgr026091 [Punica granatum]
MSREKTIREPREEMATKKPISAVLIFAMVLMAFVATTSEAAASSQSCMEKCKDEFQTKQHKPVNECELF